MALFSLSFMLLLLIGVSQGYKQFISSLSGELAAGNFSYYSMDYEGTISLELVSMTGDCDLYVSQNKLKPGYEPENNCLQSCTCGDDTVMVPKSFKRPIGIGVFGHPSRDLCTYLLMFYRIDDSEDLFNYDPYQEAHQSHTSQKPKHQTTEQYESIEEQDLKSALWAVLRSIIFFLIEIIF